MRRPRGGGPLFAWINLAATASTTPSSVSSPIPGSGSSSPPIRRRRSTGYDLTTEELGVLASAIGEDDEGGERGVEARHSKAGMLGLFAPVMGGGGRGADDVGFNPQPDPPGLPLRGEDAGIIIYGQPGEDSGIIIIGGRDGG